MRKWKKIVEWESGMKKCKDKPESRREEKNKKGNVE